MPDLPKTSPGQVVRDITRRLASMTGPKGHLLFASVERMAALEVEHMIQIPSFPVAIVHSLEAELETLDGEIWSKNVGITIVKETQAGRGQGEALEWLDNTVDLLLDEFQEDRTRALSVIYDSGDSTFSSDGSSVTIVFRTVVVSCMIDRKVT